MDVAYKLDREWPLLARGEVARRLPGWRMCQPQLRRFGTLAQLLCFLHEAPAEQTDGPLLALLALARRDRLAGRTLLQVLLPALKTQAERIVHPAKRRDEVWELLLFFAWEAICCYPLEGRRVRVAANLALQVLHQTTRELDRAHDPDDDRDDGDELARVLGLDTARSEEEVARSGEPRERSVAAAASGGESVVAQAVAAGLISERDAELILCTRVDGIRLRLLAAAHGVSYTALRKRRQRAEAALRDLLDSGCDVPKAGVSDLVLYAGRIPRMRAATSRAIAARVAHAA